MELWSQVGSISRAARDANCPLEIDFLIGWLPLRGFFKPRNYYCGLFWRSSDSVYKWRSRLTCEKGGWSVFTISGVLCMRWCVVYVPYVSHLPTLCTLRYSSGKNTCSKRLELQKSGRIWFILIALFTCVGQLYFYIIRYTWINEIFCFRTIDIIKISRIAAWSVHVNYFFLENRVLIHKNIYRIYQVTVSTPSSRSVKCGTQMSGILWHFDCQGTVCGIPFQGAI